MKDENKNCPYCDGEMMLQKDLRLGYKRFKDDPDAYSYYFQCRSCASTSGWSKSESGAKRLLNLRSEDKKQDAINQKLSNFQCPDCNGKLFIRKDNEIKNIDINNYYLQCEVCKKEFGHNSE